MSVDDVSPDDVSAQRAVKATSDQRARSGVVRRLARNPFVNLIAAFLVLALIQTFVVRLFSVPSGSMENTLDIGDRILVNRLAYLGDGPRSGDIIVFTADDWEGPQAPEANPLKAAIRWVGGIVGVGPSDRFHLVKRTIAGPGQTVSCCDPTGRVLVDGVPLDEPYVFQDFPFETGSLDCVSEPSSQRCFPEYTVPADMYFVMGDHRSASSDSLGACRGSPAPSECVRFVGRADVIGRVFQVVFPVDQWSSF